MDDNDTLIVSRLKDPWKFLLVDMDVAMVSGTVGMGLFSSGLNILIVFAVAGGIGYTMHAVRTNRPKGFVQHLMYWWLPPAMTKLKRTPPMFIVRTAG